MMTPPTRRRGSTSADGALITFIFVRSFVRFGILFFARRPFSHVTMDGVSVETGMLQASRQFIGNHHGAMTPSGTSDSHRQIRFSFALVLRQKVIEQVCEPF